MYATFCSLRTAVEARVGYINHHTTKQSSYLFLGHRKLDFTCCDIEAEIIARNTIILTLIADDEEGVLSQHLWNIYYHIFLNKGSMEVLQTHVKNLLKCSQSLQDWNLGPYASRVRFCDEGTFQAVVKLWKLYATDSSSQQEYTTIQTLLKDQWKAAQNHQKERTGGGLVLDCLSAAAPVLLSAFLDADKLYRTFWDTGTCLNDKKIVRDLTIANPMFGCLRSGIILHYGQSPLSGFHLAPAYTQVTPQSPLSLSSSKRLWPTSSNVFKVAFEQFAAWSIAYRQKLDQLTVRFVNADAVAFSNVLQHQRTHGCSEDAHWFRNLWTFETLVLDKNEYSQQGSTPTMFNVIDTSNLVDHLGSLNVLIAVAPLLENTSSSTLRTEIMVPREVDVATSAEKLLCGDLPTVSSLLGLKPTQYWTNATMTWEMNESLFPDLPESQSLARISRPVISWKRLDTSSVHYDASELAHFLYGVYLNMFADESWASRFSMLSLANRDLLQKKLHAYDLYTRASLTSLLRYVQNSNIVDWLPFIHEFVGSIIDDSVLNMGPHHFQSFFTHLEMGSLLPAGQMFDGVWPQAFAAELVGPFRRWSNIPSVICVTLVVPRKAVALFSDLSKGNGTPLCQLQLHSSISQAQNFYPDIQMGFGTVHATGEAFSDQYRITVTPDTLGWRGRSPLIVSAMVSTKSLVAHGDPAARVVFALKSTPNSIAHFSSKLGFSLHLHASKVGGKDVFVTKYRPNVEGHLSVGSLAPPHSVVGKR